MIAAGNAVRIHSEADIPDFLRETISIEGGEMVMHNAEDEGQRTPFGTVCGFEMSQKTASGYGTWPVADEKRAAELGRNADFMIPDSASVELRIEMQGSN